MGKHPRIKGWKESASTDEAEIRRWWGLWPDANIGIATGRSLVVLDVDPRNDGNSSLEAVGAEYGEIITRTARTGGGGLHLYLQGDLPARGAFRPGLDLKAAGGYVVAPPSKHASGRRYGWVNVEEGIRVVPDWLAKIVSTSKSQKGTADPLPDTITSGERNNTLTSLAGSMRRRGASEESIRAALEVENAARCTPPLFDAEVQEIAASVARYEPEGDPVGPVDVDGLPKLVCALHAPEPKPVEWEVPGLIPAGQIGAVVGPGGGGKDSLVLLLYWL